MMQCERKRWRVEVGVSTSTGERWGLVYLCLMLTGYCYNICIWFALLASDPVKKKELPRKMMMMDSMDVEDGTEM